MAASFYDDLPENRSERREKMFEAADRICSFDQQFESRIEVSMLEETSAESDDVVRRAHFAAQIVNEFGGDVPVKPLGDFRAGASDVTKYAPLVASYNRLAVASCAASQNRTDASLKDFQIAALMFGVDAMLISSGGFYRPAFAGTRFLTNGASKLGLYRLRYVCGNRCWALGMSEVHVALRGSMITASSNLIQTSVEMGVELNRSNLQAVAKAQGTDVETLVQTENTSVSQSAVGKTSIDVQNCSEKLVDLGKNASIDTDGFSGIFGSGDAGVQDKTGDIVDAAENKVNETKSHAAECGESP